MNLADQWLLAGGLLFLLSILATALSPRLGVPILLIFLLMGLLAGEDGPGGIAFNNYAVANLACTTALGMILFDGGLRTPMETIRLGSWASLSLAVLGTVVTSTIVGVCAAILLKLSWAEGLLLGAIVGSTDASAVFSLLGNNAVQLNKRLTSVLEVESGINDPIAAMLSIALVTYLLHPHNFSLGSISILLAKQIGFGVAFGVLGGRSLVLLVNRVEIAESLYPLLVLSGGMLIFGATACLGGSGFLAVYLAGIAIGNQPLRALGAVRRFHDGMAWLAQISMFLMLGLLATPSRLVEVAPLAIAVAAVLMFVARPAAVALSLLPFRFAIRERVYIAWVGLRGSVPLVLATFPLLAGLHHATLYFDVAFFIVLVSLVVQGWSVAVSAKWLGLRLPDMRARIRRQEIDLPGCKGQELVSYQIVEHCPLIGRKPKSLPIPDVSRIVGIARRGQLLPYRKWGHFEQGDFVSLLADHQELTRLDELFSAQPPPPPAGASEPAPAPQSVRNPL